MIEDQPRLLGSISRTLEESGYAVSPVQTLSDATREFDPTVDVVVLDLMLPDGNGLDWLAGICAANHRTPVLILTARDSIPDRIAGLDTGADDYLVKPFSLDELLARLRALLRRDASPASNLLSVGSLTADLLARSASRNAQPLELQNRQFELLIYLMRHANEIVTREMITRDVWKEPTATWTNVIEVHINQLRKQLDGPSRPPILHTVRGRGYVLGDLP